MMNAIIIVTSECSWIVRVLLLIARFRVPFAWVGEECRVRFATFRRVHFQRAQDALTVHSLHDSLSIYPVRESESLIIRLHDSVHSQDQRISKSQKH